MYNFEFIKGHISDVVNSRGLKLTYGVQTWEENVIRGDECENWYSNDDVLILYYYKDDYLYVEGLLSWDFDTLYNMFPPDFEAIHKDEMYFMESHDINRVISIMNSYFTEHNNKEKLIGELMRYSNNNPYVREHILNTITDKE
jgi:hypothetical protein